MSAAPGETGLSGQDISFLAWESSLRPMHIAVRARFLSGPGDPVPSFAAFRRVLGARILGEPRLHCRLRRRGWLRRWTWEPDRDFRLERHLLCAPPGSMDRDRIDAILREPLDRTRPLWEMWFVRDESDPRRFDLLIKMHHVLIDGMAGVALLERLLGAAPPAGASAARSGRPARPSRTAGTRRRRTSSLLRFVREQLRGAPRNPLNGRVSPRRHRMVECDAESFDGLARSMGGSHNDLVLGVVAGSLRRWLARHSEAPAPSGLRAFCPVNLRAAGRASGYGNRIAPWTVPLPLDEPSLERRVARVTRATSAMKQRGDQLGGDGMARVIARFGGWVAWLGMVVAAWRRSTSVVVSNVPGPDRPMRLLGASLVDLHAFAPIFPGQRLSIAVVRYGGRLAWGLASGWPHDAGADHFAADLRAELAALAPARSSDGRAA